MMVSTLDHCFSTSLIFFCNNSNQWKYLIHLIPCNRYVNAPVLRNIWCSHLTAPYSPFNYLIMHVQFGVVSVGFAEVKIPPIIDYFGMDE